jgi:hypothetical protein
MKHIGDCVHRRLQLVSILSPMKSVHASPILFLRSCEYYSLTYVFELAYFLSECVYLSFIPIHATCTTHLILTDLMILINAC